MKVPIDDHDYLLLQALQRNNLMTQYELSEVAGLSPASCMRRVKWLRDNKIILRDISLVAPETFGRRLTAIVHVTLTQKRLDILDNFKKLIRSTPEILQCYHVTGESDFVFTIAVADMAEYDDFVKMFFTKNQDVRDYVSMFVLSKVKFETAMEPAVDAKE